MQWLSYLTPRIVVCRCARHRRWWFPYVIRTKKLFTGRSARSSSRKKIVFLGICAHNIKLRKKNLYSTYISFHPSIKRLGKSILLFGLKEGIGELLELFLCPLWSSLLPALWWFVLWLILSKTNYNAVSHRCRTSGISLLAVADTAVSSLFFPP